jgi:raffinose/stachyose/melibiose transport system permease protein
MRRKGLASLVAALFVVPLYMALVNVFKPGHLIARSPASLPIPPTLDNIRAVLNRTDNLFWVSLTNSLIVTSLSIGVLTVLSAMLGHYLTPFCSSVD